MGIGQFMELCIEASLCEVTVYSTSEERDVWTGQGDEIPREYYSMEFESFDIPRDGHMTFNIG